MISALDVISADGRATLRFKSLSGAAVSITGTSVDGWKMWDIKLPEGNEWLVSNRWRDMQGK